MKRTLLTLYCFVILLCAQAQEDKKATVGVSSMISHLSLGNGIAGDVGIGSSDSSKIETQIKSGVLTLGVDFNPGGNFTVGILVGYQKINSTVNDTFNKFLEKGDINRVYLGVRGLWHYGKSDRIDLYSGVKAGVKVFSTSEISGPEAGRSVLRKKNNRTAIAIGIIPIGARFLITENIGAHIQMSIGAPTFLSLGINYKIL
jgi:hypothetical protein